MSDANTRAVDHRKVDGVLTVKYRSAATRSGATVADCENLIYVANFEDEQGYAILAADDRIDEPVLAITDQGNLTDENIDDAVDAVVNPQRDFFEGYPATGPGIYTLPETGDQLYMNPNTVNLYLADKDDTLVGNFVPKTTVPEEGPDSVGFEDRGDSDIDPASVETLPTSLCVIYALQSVSTNRYRKSAPSDSPYPNPNDTISRDSLPDDHPDPDGGPADRSETINSDWYVVGSVKPMLEDYVYWSQSSPFNDYYQKVRSYLVVGREKNASAGCFPLSLAKIITYYEKPYYCSYNNIYVDWDELKRFYYPYTMSSLAKRSAAALLAAIDLGCDCWHFYQGTFTFPSDARDFFSFIGYRNVAEHDYSWDVSKQMLDGGKPFCVYGMPHWDLKYSHCWNIDGYKIKEQKITTNRYVNNKLEGTSVTYKRVNMVHCDFGWRGQYNGYYISGLFKQMGNEWESDGSPIYEKPHNYDTYLHIMTYDL